MLITELTTKALNFAYKKHNGQYDKQGVPYIFHPYTVASYVNTEEETLVALLHDILEDTKTTKKELYDNFPKEVVDTVIILTRQNDEPYRDYIKKIKLNKLATTVKLADLKHNTDPTRGVIPESLKNRYEWAKKYLTE